MSLITQSYLVVCYINLMLQTDSLAHYCNVSHIQQVTVIADVSVEQTEFFAIFLQSPCVSGKQMFRKFL